MTICSAHQKTEDLIASYCELQKLYAELWSYSLAAENIVKRVVFVNRERLGERESVREWVWAAQSGIQLKNHRKLQAFQHRLIQSRAEHSFDVGVQARMSQIESEQKCTSLCECVTYLLMLWLLLWLLWLWVTLKCHTDVVASKTNERIVRRHHMQRL